MLDFNIFFPNIGEYRIYFGTNFSLNPHKVSKLAMVYDSFKSSKRSVTKVLEQFSFTLASIVTDIHHNPWGVEKLKSSSALSLWMYVSENAFYYSG